MAAAALRARLDAAAARVGSNPLDGALALVGVALVAIDLDYTGVHPVLGYGVALPALLALAWRRRNPAAVAVVVCAANLMISLAATNPYGSQTATIPVIVAVYTVAAYTAGRTALVGGALTLALVESAHVATREGDGTDFLALLVWGAAWTAGRLVRRRTLDAARAAADAAVQVRRSEEEARAAIGRERDRIARELHDVVAHAVSLVVVQAGAERLALGTSAPRTRGVLDAIETAGREALVELRAMLAVLRSDDDADAELGPQPDLGALDALVDRVRDAGLAVDASVRVTPGVPAGVGLSAYRIVQEALTNALKHSAPSAAVAVGDDGRAVTVEVRSPLGSSTAAPPAGSGRGLVGMRERATLHGGTFAAGPEGAEWVVRARLPYAVAPAAGSRPATAARR